MDLLYEELWRACAGPLVDVPKEGERVFYFPQGHMEQVLFFFFCFFDSHFTVCDLDGESEVLSNGCCFRSSSCS